MMAALTLNACGSVEIKDELVCGDMGSRGATCDWMQHSDPIDYDKNHWDDIRFGEFCVSSDAYADLKSEIEKLCSLNHSSCTYPSSPSLNRLYQRVKALK